MEDQDKLEGVEVEILSLGPPLYSKADEIVGHSVSRIRDTTGQTGGLAVFLDGTRVGTAVTLTTTVCEGREALCYLACLALTPIEIDDMRSPDGHLWAGSLKAAGWTNGIYPTAIHLQRFE